MSLRTLLAQLAWRHERERRAEPKGEGPRSAFSSALPADPQAEVSAARAELEEALVALRLAHVVSRGPHPKDPEEGRDALEAAQRKFDAARFRLQTALLRQG